MSAVQSLGDFCEKLGCRVAFAEPMSRHTTFKIGGPAEIFLTVFDRETMQMVLQKANDLQIPCTVIGNGSNLLVSDAGIKGAVIALDGEFKQLKLLENDEIFCGAGVTLSQFCSFALQHSLTGAEFLWGIPGTMGGAVMMNAGAYGGEICNIAKKAEHIDTKGVFGTFEKESLQFSYRHSAYTGSDFVILSCTAQLQKGEKSEIRAKMDDFFDRRKTKQPLEYPSAGSVFKRPVGYFAGALIEQCGLKGKKIGDAMVSEKHAGFIVNCGKATCRDVETLIHFIQETVKTETGVALECEVKRIGVSGI